MTSGFRRFVVIAGMRTGSNLLERLLSQFPSLVCHGELFNPTFIGKKDRTEFLGLTMAGRERDPMGLLRRVEDDAQGRIPGFRLFDGHDSRVMDAVLEDPATAKILLRRDPLHSFVSLLIARATDQWMLGNAAKRKTARVYFDNRAFTAFRAERDAFERRILARLQASGQVPFVVQYTDLKSLECINGLARYIGATETLSEFAEPIKRQNPEPLSEKVENFDEMRAALAQSVIPTEEEPAAAPRGPSIPALMTANARPLLYAPMPGVPSKPVEAWFEGLGGQTTGHNRASLNQWLDAAPGHFAFTIVDHPLARAWRAFMLRIVPGDASGYPKIRRRLINHHGLVLPDDPANWPAADRAQAFETFLQFLKNNIAGQTGIRIDPEWAPQGDMLPGISAAVHLRATFRQGEGRDQLAQVAGVPRGPAFPAEPPGLDAIYSKRMENLARGAYPHDYRKFGFSDWAPDRA